jgi:phage gpG-like protein
MEFIITDSGTPKIVGTRLTESGDMTLEMNEVMKLILLDMMRANAENIASGGRRFGGSYANLRPNTVIKKGGAEILYTMGSRPNYTKLGDDTLVRSVTEPDTPYQISKTTNDSVVLGTNRPYAGTHQRGNVERKIPRRPFLVAATQDKERWNRWITDKLMEPLRVE